jgi:hypothetical protein
MRDSLPASAWYTWNVSCTATGVTPSSSGKRCSNAMWPFATTRGGRGATFTRLFHPQSTPLHMPLTGLVALLLLLLLGGRSALVQGSEPSSIMLLNPSWSSISQPSAVLLGASGPNLRVHKAGRAATLTRQLSHMRCCVCCRAYCKTANSNHIYCLCCSVHSNQAAT